MACQGMEEDIVMMTVDDDQPKFSVGTKRPCYVSFECYLWPEWEWFVVLWMYVSDA